MSIYKKIAASLALLSPMVTLAVTWDGNSYFTGIATTFTDVIATILPAFIGLVIIGFAYGLFVYVRGGAEDKEKGKSIMIWGGLAVIVLLSIYGIAGLLQDLTGADANIDNLPTTLEGLN